MSATTDHVDTDIPFLNIVDPQFDLTSAEVVEAQAKNWYADTPVGLLVLRHAEATDLMRDPRLDHNGRRLMEITGITDGPIHDWFVPMILNQDGQEHRRLRGLVAKAFTPRTIENLRPFIRAQAELLTERIAAVEECEFVAEFGNMLPHAVLCELIGVPPEDFAAFHTWTTDIGLVFSLTHRPELLDRVTAAVVGLHDYVDLLFSAKTRAPADDLVSALLTVARAEGRVSEEELRNLVVTLIFGAHDTTRHQLANAMVTFADHPDQWTLLGRRPELAEQATYEVMRWHPSVISPYRFASVDFEYRGMPIAKDTYFLICATAAQRDPRVYPNGHVFDITVDRTVPLIQFGGGPHHCLGAALARVEVSEALPILARRLGAPVVAGPVSWRPPTGIYGPETLPLRFGPT